MTSRILHIHSDYPDGRKGFPFTRAVENLINDADSFEHFVISINRTSNPLNVSVKPFNKGISIVYWCIPVSLFYSVGVWLLCRRLKKILKSQDFDLIHAHKMTTEGLVAKFLADSYSKPYCLSIRGGTDLRNIQRFEYLRETFSSVLSSAAHVFWVSPWAKPKVLPYLGVSPKSESNFPNPCTLPTKMQSGVGKGNRFYTVLSYHQYKRKGVIEIIRAVSRLKEEGESLHLDIYGGGDDCVKALLVREIEQLGLGEQVVLKGQVDHDKLLGEIPKYKALVLPAVHETFGMVYVEALACGVPFIAHKNTGVDGYFSGEYAVFVHSQAEAEIAQAIQVIIANSAKIDSDLQELEKSGYLLEFSRTNVLSLYNDKISGLLNV